MSRSRDRGDTPLLFDLPMDAGETQRPSTAQEAAQSPESTKKSSEETLTATQSKEGETESLPLFAAAGDSPDLEDRETASAQVGAVPPSPPLPAPLGKRFLAGAIDLAVWLATLLFLALGASFLGVGLSVRDWPAAVLFVAAFSFLYTVIPLAFWGKTPGMAWARIVAHAGKGEPLTFGQTGIRWLATLVTLAFLGLPSLLALFPGGSLVDRWSHSHTDQD